MSEFADYVEMHNKFAEKADECLARFYDEVYGWETPDRLRYVGLKDGYLVFASEFAETEGHPYDLILNTDDFINKEKAKQLEYSIQSIERQIRTIENKKLQLENKLKLLGEK